MLDKPVSSDLPEPLQGELMEAVCIKCGTAEWIMPLDGSIDAIFLANYHCNECDLET